jgi:ribosomal protein S18 acetylase RimI-like enzyme
VVDREPTTGVVSVNDHGERLARVDAGPRRGELLPLFLLADESEMQVRSYYQRGQLFVLEGVAGDVRGITLAIREEGDTVELKAVAVPRALQRQGVGRRMLAMVLAHLQSTGVRRVTVGTGNSELGPIAFYQRVGFRLRRIERDFFTPERGYAPGIEVNGIPLRDMVWMDLALEGPLSAASSAEA